MNSTDGNAKKIFYGSALLVIAVGIVSTLYYAYLMPLHVDEGAFWFHYTNKSYQYRFMPNAFNAVHTLTIYLAKISLWLFGNNGIGLRLPVIIFAILSAGALYFFVKKLTGSKTTGMLASALLYLNPFFLHYAHELRGYPAYFFVLVCFYLCFIRLLEKGNQFSTWAMLFVLFIACYLTNLAAPIFFVVFLASIWILVILRSYAPVGDRVPELRKIHRGSFFAYSTVAALLFVFIMFYIDKFITPNLLVVTKSEINFLAIPDLFSAFLGYQYLDDPTSLLYSYPTIIWLISLSSFLYGWWICMQNRNWHATVFLLMFILNSLFYITLQKWIPLRSSIYLLPFMLLFQAHGLKAFINLAVTRFSPRAHFEKNGYLILAGVLICYFSFFSIGKFRNFEPESGNPYELTRAYLKKNMGSNDLIISSLYDTLGGFYLGEMLRKQNSAIYKSGKIENIYYLTSKPGASNIKLDRVYPSREKIDLLPLDKFEAVVSYENKGIRPSSIHIFKRKVEINSIAHLNQQNLSSPNYFGNYRKPCKIEIAEEGIRIECDSSSFSCVNQVLNLADVAEADMQFVLFHHINDKGTKTTSFASVKGAAMTANKNQPFEPFPNVYMLNPLITNINDLDIYRKKVDLIDVSLQKMGGDKEALFCMFGKLFEGNSVIQGVKIFNWKL